MTAQRSDTEQTFALLEERLAVAELRCAAAEQTLRALRAGEVDAIVIDSGLGGQRLYTLENEDRPYFRGLVEAAPDAIVGVDADGVIVLVNAQTERLFGYRRGELLGRHIEMLVPPSVRTVHPGLRAGYVADPRPRLMGADLELAGRRRDGSEFPAEISLSSFDTADGIVVTAAVRDVTDRKQTELQLRLVEQRVALFDQRHQIAEDLHDLVVQRLFAAELQLVSVARFGGDDTAARIAAACESIDDAIIELRVSIHNLTTGLESADLAAAVDRVVRQSARTLGFEPTIAFTSTPEAVPPAIGAELLAVLNEALSNTARHAHASHVDITIDARGDEIALRVTDDGRGITRHEPGTGITNMTARARRLGGTFSWQINQPTGTTIDWRVPVPDRD